MIDKLKEFWKDPVWSKVISAIIIAVLFFIYSKLFPDVENINLGSTWERFWYFKVELWYIILVIIILFLIDYLTPLIFKKDGFVYDERTLSLDRKTFEKIRDELLPQNGSIYFLRNSNFAGFSFERRRLDDLDKFESMNNNSDFYFFNPTLENLRVELGEHVSYFLGVIALRTFPINEHRQIVPPEWETDMPKKFHEAVNELHTSKRAIQNKYDELIKEGRNLLRV